MDIVIIGAGGFAREVRQLIDDINQDRQSYNLIGFLDGNSDRHGQIMQELPVLGGLDWLEQHLDTVAVIGIGNPPAKRRIALELEGMGVSSPVLVHPRATVGRWVAMGAGTLICAGNILTTDIRLGKHAILNLDCTVGHDAILEDYVTVAPGVHISGNVTVQEGTDLGTGSSIVQGIRIGSWSIIGAGAVVSKEIPDNVTAVGVPAKPIKEREPGWYL
jgi:sugar O-acyltransferase (sialic acid O-acetyltransferase NeuD family)